jgi:hypothetical protein
VEEGQTPALEQMNRQAWHGYGAPSFNGFIQPNAPFLPYYSNPSLGVGGGNALGTTQQAAVARNQSAPIGINNVPRYDPHSINEHLQMQQTYAMTQQNINPQVQDPSYRLFPYSTQHGSVHGHGPAAVAPIMSKRPDVVGNGNTNIQNSTFMNGPYSVHHGFPVQPFPTNPATSDVSQVTSRKRSGSGGVHGINGHSGSRKQHKKNWLPVDDVMPSRDKNEEEQLMKVYYGSTHLRMSYSSKVGAKLQYKTFVCKVQGCPFECRIRRNNETDLWLTERTSDEHNHMTSTEGLSTVDAGNEFWGLPDEFKVKIIESRKTLASLSVDPTPITLTRILKDTFPDHVLCHRDNRDKLHGKVVSYVAALDAKDRGVSMNNIGDFGRYKNANKLNVPDTLEPTTSYKSPEEIAVALGFDKNEVDKQLVLMPPDDVLKEFQDLYGDEENSMSSSLFVVTPASLFTLLQLLTKVPEGFRLAYVDGSRNFILENGAAFIPIGTHDVSYREHRYTMSQSLHPFGYALAPGERTKVLACFLRLLRICSMRLFGVEFAPDFGGLDHSAAFAGGFTQEFGNHMKLLLCYFHAMQIIEDKKKDRPWGVIVGTTAQKESFQDSIIGAFRNLHRRFQTRYRVLSEQGSTCVCRSPSQNLRAISMELFLLRQWSAWCDAYWITSRELQ